MGELSRRETGRIVPTSDGDFPDVGGVSIREFQRVKNCKLIDHIKWKGKEL